MSLIFFFFYGTLPAPVNVVNIGKWSFLTQTMIFFEKKKEHALRKIFSTRGLLHAITGSTLGLPRALVALLDMSVKVFQSVKMDWTNNSHHISCNGEGNKAFTGNRFI